MLVLAGPGSGKTTVISERVRYLIEKKGVKPERILIITFTKSAAAEMQNRCRKICPQAKNAVFGTFHSVFYHMLRKSNAYQNFTVVSEKEKKKIMKKIIPADNMTQLQHEYVCENLLKKISYYKNSQSKNIPEAEGDEFVSVMERYTNLCYENGKLDFDDMIVLCRKLLQQKENERVKWQNHFDYLLIDEFQDINACQYEIVKMLSEKHGNVFCVGDDDQAIYSFRGADPWIMKQFLRDYPNSRQVCLEDNYRSGAGIVALAGSCIKGNKNRFEKNVCAKSALDYEVKIERYDSAVDEMNDIALQIKNYSGTDAAILVRTNMQAEFVTEILEKNEVKYVYREKRKCFYENEWVKDILAVLRFVYCGQKRKDLFVFMNKPFRGIERAWFLEERVNLKKIKIREVEKLAYSLETMRGLDPYGAVMFVLGGLRYRTYMNEVIGNNQKMKEQTDDIIQELLLRIKEYTTVPAFLEFVETYTDNFEEKTEETQPEGVRIMTYHASKGLEFTSVYLPMINAGKVPHGRMMTEEQTEEERRMFYVAMTRARSRLFISWHGKADGMQKSVFLKELEQEKIST